MIVLSAGLAMAQPRGGGGPDDRGGGTSAPRDADVVQSSGRPEYILVVPPAQAQPAIDALVAAGAQSLRQRPFAALGRLTVVFLLPRQLDLQDARSAVAPVAPDGVFDLHHIYRFAQAAPRIYAPTLIDDAGASRCSAPESVTVGLIDGPVDASHPALAASSVVSESVLGQGDRGASRAHGTAIAALIVGRDGAGNLSGFAQGARLHTITAFRREGGGNATDVEHIGSALDRLTGRGVWLINMSFAGPENRAFADLLSAAAWRGAVMVAAAGNDRTSRPVHPAAHPDVIAVTAVDALLRRKGAANNGAHIEVAAPGVDLFVAGGRGGAYESGTSHSAAIVSALVARMGRVAAERAVAA
ncbi:S8 family serine peptidase [Rhodophyticola porphyridii]|nr:S8 family serine peptidase [Rhodophyticola porphyridii]